MYHQKDSLDICIEKGVSSRVTGFLVAIWPKLLEAMYVQILLLSCS